MKKIRTLVVSAALVVNASIDVQAQGYYNTPSYNGSYQQYLPQPRVNPPQYLPQQQYDTQQFNPPQQFDQPPPIGGYYGGCYTRNLGGGMSPCR